MKFAWLFIFSVVFGLLSSPVGAAIPPLATSAGEKKSSSQAMIKTLPATVSDSNLRLSERLDVIRAQIVDFQKEVLQSLQVRQSARSQIEKIKSLMALQKRERQLGNERLEELEKTVRELESRRATLSERTEQRKALVRRRLQALLREPEYLKSPLILNEQGERDQVHRQVLSRLARTSLRELEELKVDLADADQLEKRIQDEKQQLTYLFQDLEEQQSLLALNEQIQIDLLKKEHQNRVAQLESYRKLKSSEAHLERMIRDFNARRELEASLERDRANARAARAMEESVFAQLKGRLTLPVTGKVLTKFGRFLDPKSQLNVFKKGIDIEVSAKMPVRSVATGKVAFAGELPNYGKVLIMDHGDHYYTLCGNLGELRRKTGEEVRAGDVVGESSRDGAPVYFEIRSRNIAVNPLQWVSSSISLNP